MNCKLGIGLEKTNPWAFDTTQFDNILKKLKVVSVCFGAEILLRDLSTFLSNLNLRFMILLIFVLFIFGVLSCLVYIVPMKSCSLQFFAHIMKMIMFVYYEFFILICWQKSN